MPRAGAEGFDTCFRLVLTLSINTLRVDEYEDEGPQIFGVKVLRKLLLGAGVHTSRKALAFKL